MFVKVCSTGCACLGCYCIDDCLVGFVVLFVLGLDVLCFAWCHFGVFVCICLGLV